MENYNLIAHNYANERSRSRIGLEEVRNLLDRLTTNRLPNGLPEGASVLDVGCGPGIPISECILQHSAEVRLFGVDSSQEMVKLFRANFPDVPVQHASILDFDFFGRKFDAVISWGMMFHLSVEEQIRAIRSIASVLKPGGYFLFSSGNEAETQHGMMYDVEFSYFSLGAESYRSVLQANGLTVLDEHFDEGENYYYLAQLVREM
ncbi:MAG: methyltransferase domain-containing protein [Ignavibacteria bacterium]|nr:methyltransferase domain-containing protein [Ignavibacteria bacterium]